jgi:broad specificity phosphatase PhoE
VSRQVDVYRHTDNAGDALSEEGVDAALRLGSELEGGYHVIVTSGAQRATQTAACILAGSGQVVPGGVVVEPRLRSTRESEWRAAYEKAGDAGLLSLRKADPDLVASDSEDLAVGLAAVFGLIDDGQSALVIGHSPTNEAAILGLTGHVVEPLGKGEAARVVATDDGYEVGSAG